MIWVFGLTQKAITSRQSCDPTRGGGLELLFDGVCKIRSKTPTGTYIAFGSTVRICQSTWEERANFAVRCCLFVCFSFVWGSMIFVYWDPLLMVFQPPSLLVLTVFRNLRKKGP